MLFSLRQELKRLQWWGRLHSDALRALPTAILSITDQCNSGCNCCDYWRAENKEFPLGLAQRLVENLASFGTRYVMLTGGEPLQHPHWASIAAMFKDKNIKVALATNGILVGNHTEAILSCIDELYISLDGATAATYKAVRGVDGLGLIERGMERIAASLPVTFRTTVQRINYREMPAMIRLTRSWGAAHHSFLAVDVHNPAAFARTDGFDRSLVLQAEDLDPFAAVIDDLEKEFEAEFERRYIVESKSKLRDLHHYFAALLGLRKFPPVRCNAPRFSAFIQTDGSFKPCFFHSPYAPGDGASIESVMNTAAATGLRRHQRSGRWPECARCVCPAFKYGRDLLEDV